ncbi:MAG: magnesium transporter [Candidatus Aenigmarchaeota archaeon]|nr:magnesium transporter [Candidatus Aenigmarchaeota archaeon]MCX8190585.1 magnesium transporter [Candidatus Aenigmarchaeota archaeon]MDW8160128.1 magnesium transporter [Candidatus Aenigmarchaeota archaeon]
MKLAVEERKEKMEEMKILKTLSKLEDNFLVDVLPKLPLKTRAEIFSKLSKDRVRVRKILKKLPLDESLQILHNLSKKTREEILASLTKKEKEKFTLLLKYGSKSAASIMTDKFVAVDGRKRCKDVIKVLKKKNRKNYVYHIYVLDEKGRLVGVVSLRKLFFSDPKKRIKDIMRKNILKAYLDNNYEEVLKIVRENNLMAIPVVDKNERLFGIITIDDVLKIVEREAHEDISLLSGTMPLENVISSKTSMLIKARLPALIIGVFGALLASFVVSGFEDLVNKFLPLAFFMPLLVYISDATGTQTEATTIRTLALDPKTPFLKYLLKQVKSVIALGLIIGSLVGSIIWSIWGREYGIVAGIATFLSMNVSNLFTASLPFFYRKIGLDPAAISGPIDTIMSDVLTLLIYFSVALLLLF